MAPPEPSPTYDCRVRSPPLKSSQLQLKADWRYEESERRQHYLIEAWIDGQCAGRAHGWFEPGAQFVLEKIELDRSQRSRGYGTAVIEQLRAKAREKQCTELVFKGVRAANRRAIKLYESMGAVPVRTSDTLYSFVLSPP